MKYVNLGRSGLKVSRLCLGCMSYGEPFPRFRIRRLQRSRTINTLPWPGVAGSPRPLIPGH